MANYSQKKKEDYSAIRKMNANNMYCKCACCHKSILVQDTILDYTCHEDRIMENEIRGKYVASIDIYAYRICSDCKREKEEKERVKEIKHDKRLKYIGLSVWIWFFVGIAIFLVGLMLDSKNFVPVFLGLWFILLPMILMIVGVVCVVLLFWVIIPIYDKFSIRDGIDFDNALRDNAVHWFEKY